MKKVYTVFSAVFLLVMHAPYSLSGGIDNRSNYSGEYVRTFNRNAATDSSDAIAYNPAGVMKMKDGFHGSFSIHYVLKEYTNRVDNIIFRQDTPSFVPALFGLYKNDRWAGFFSFTMPAGGGEVDYDNGNATTRISAHGLRNSLNNMAGAPIYGDIVNERLNAEGFYYGFTAGGAYKINEMVSISVAGRYIDANKKARATFELLPTPIGILAGQPIRSAVLDQEENANGWGMIFGAGIDLDPIYIGMKYETETSLDFRYKIKQDTVTGLPYGLGQTRGIVNGAEHERNLPALFSIGLAYTVSPKLKIDAGLIYYFHEDAGWGGDEQFAENGWEAAFSIEYRFNDNIKGSIGYLHTSTGMDAQHALKEAPELDADSYGAGVVYQVNEGIRIDLGAALVDYKSGSYVDTSSGSALLIGLNKEVIMFSAGIQYCF